MKAKALVSFALAVFLTGSLLAQTKKPLTNEDVIQMVKAGFEQSMILKAIEANETNFDVSVQALLDLKTAAVPQAVIEAMLRAEAKKKPFSPATNTRLPESVSGAQAESSVQVIIGKWSGQARQSDGLTYPVTVEILQSKDGTIAYPTFKCGGSLTFMRQEGANSIFRETISYGRFDGKTGCIDAGTVQIQKIDETTIRCEWVDADTSRGLSASATLRAQDPNKPLGAEIQRPATPDEVKRFLKDRYDGKEVCVVVPGLFAGEQEQAFLVGAGKNAITWHHFHETQIIPNSVSSYGQLLRTKTSDLHRLDERTLGDLVQGLNVTTLEKGEPLKVHKFYVARGAVDLVLTTTQLSHVRDLDINKASKETKTTIVGDEARQKVYVPGFGLVFRFYFAPDLLKSPWGYDTVIAEINKYLLPEAEYRTQHAALEEAAKKVEIQPGMTREQVIKALGEPLKTIVFGNKTILKYQDITVELVENKVVEVKVN